MIFELFYDIPLIVFLILTFIVLFFAFRGGALLGQKHRLISEPDDRSPVGSIVAATLGLLAFLLAFTFGIAASKFDDRRMLVMDEANVIRTTYLRAGYLPNPYRLEIRNLLIEYISHRLKAVESPHLELSVKESEELQARLWHQAVDLAEKNSNSEMIALFIESLNELFSLHAKRVNLGIYVRIPMIIWIALFFVTILAIGSVGYQMGLIQAHYLGITLLLILTISAVFVLIADLDRPQEGFIKVSQKSLVDLLNQFNR